MFIYNVAYTIMVEHSTLHPLQLTHVANVNLDNSNNVAPQQIAVVLEAMNRKKIKTNIKTECKTEHCRLTKRTNNIPNVVVPQRGGWRWADEGNICWN